MKKKIKYLFIVQGEGRGHLTQAITLEKWLLKRGHEVTRILVGKSAGKELPSFFEKEVKAPVSCFDTVTFVPSAKNKRPNMIRTFFYNTLLWFRFLPSIKKVRREIKYSGADVVVNFYETVGSVAYMNSGRKIPMVVIAHQFLFLHKDMHLPMIGYEGHHALNLFSMMLANGASKVLALSFREMEDDVQKKIKVVPPMLRPEVLEITPSAGDYILGYIVNAGFAEEVMKWHSARPDVNLHFFWDDRSKGDVYKVDETLTFYYLNDKEFLRQMAGCRAYASTAGFESICEAMYLGKPLLMVPSHIEQKCNAYDATLESAAVSAESFDLNVLEEFIESGFHPALAFPEWVRSAEEIIIKELEDICIKKL